MFRSKIDHLPVSMSEFCHHAVGRSGSGIGRESQVSQPELTTL
jgi:hypothetical protein